MSKQETPRPTKYGQGIKIKGLQLRVIKQAENLSEAEQFSRLITGSPTQLKIYGQPTDMYLIDREVPLDIDINKGSTISLKEKIDIIDQAKYLYNEYYPWKKQSTNAMFQFHLEDSQEDEIFLNTGSIFDYDIGEIINLLWDTLDTYQGWVDHDKESTSGKE